MAWDVEYTDEFEERLAVRVGTDNTFHWLKAFMRNI
jgi:hypothetical protein